MKGIHIIGNVLQGDAAHTAYGVGKIFVHHFLGNANGLKDLGALVRLDGGNSHFGGDLHNAVKHRHIIVHYSRIIILIQHS